MPCRRFIRSMICFVLVMGYSPILAIGDEGYQIISTAELHQWLDSKEKPVLAFSLSPLEFSNEHISGSYCIPFEIMQNYYNMPEDKQRAMVFYCIGPG